MSVTEASLLSGKILLQGKSGRAYCILSKGVPLLLKTSEGVVEPTDPVKLQAYKNKSIRLHFTHIQWKTPNPCIT